MVKKYSVETLCISDSKYWIPDPLSEEYGFQIPNSNRLRDSGLQGPGFQIPESGLLFVGRYNQKNIER